MKYLILLLGLAFIEAGIINTKPKCVTIKRTGYEEEVLKRGVNSPYQLTVDHHTSTLFFSYTTETTEAFQIAYINFNTHDSGLVSGIREGFAIAVDRTSHKVYMGGEDGVYQFNYVTKAATSLNIKSDAKIWQMYYKDGLYFITYPDEKVFLYKNQEVIQVPEFKEKVMVLGVKNDGSYVYANSSGFFTYNKATCKIWNLGDYTVNGITADIHGSIYFSTPSGIYYINEQQNVIEEIMSQENIYGVAIEENGNIIYANEDSIIRLKQKSEECSDSNMTNDAL